MDIRIRCRRLLGVLGLTVALAVPLTGCSEPAEAAAATHAQRETRLLRQEVEQLRVQLERAEVDRAELQKQVAALRETSYLTSAPGGIALRLNLGATAVIIAALIALTLIRITRMKLNADEDGPAATRRPHGDS